jgi:hypothetical protein
MDLIQKFQAVAVNRKIAEIAKPTRVEFNKPYPIMAAHMHIYMESINISLSLKMSDNGDNFVLGYYDLSPAYSRVFDNDDIGELNANHGRLKLVYKKKDCCDYCHFLVIET